MKLFVATVVLLFMINNIHGDPDPDPHSINIQINQKVDFNGCHCHGCCEPPTTTPKIPTTSTTEMLTTTTYCDSLRTTICDDGILRCHPNATCFLSREGYFCKCNYGYAGDGADCGTDSDGDSWPDVELDCCEEQDHCSADNCPAKPNSGQEDCDQDGMGDACDDDQSTCPTPPPPCTNSTECPCEPRKPDTCCPITSNAWRTLDSDNDGHVDSCDNCPYDYNLDQFDTDSDSLGDACDTDQDADNDGKDDGIDNCINVPNPDQNDVDSDGIGDACDDDADDDGIPNANDNCWLVPNHGQEDRNNDKIGDICENDFDGDCCPDDVCPENPTIHKADFNHYQRVVLDPTDNQPPPTFYITSGGAEIYQTENSVAGLMFGPHTLSGVDFEGTFFIEAKGGDDDYAGFIFGYQDSKTFYVVMWKRGQQKYWNGHDSLGLAGVQLKKVQSVTGPDEFLGDALWATSTTVDQVTLLWHDPSMVPWVHDQAYRWELIHRPHIGLIRFRFLEGSTIISDSGNIYDGDIQSGHLGVYCHSQADIKWSDLQYFCNDKSVPQEVYDDLHPRQQANIEVDPYKHWSGVVRTTRKKMKLLISDTEPGLNISDPQSIP